MLQLLTICNNGAYSFNLNMKLQLGNAMFYVSHRKDNNLTYIFVAGCAYKCSLPIELLPFDHSEFILFDSK